MMRLSDLETDAWHKKIAAAVASERERCAKIAESFDGYTGRGHEDENTLVGMFARGNRSARRQIAAAIRADL